MLCASNQCISASQIGPSASCTVARPFIFRQRGAAVYAVQITSDVHPQPAAMLSTCLISLRISNAVVSRHRSRSQTCAGRAQFLLSPNLRGDDGSSAIVHPLVLTRRPTVRCMGWLGGCPSNGGASRWIVIEAPPAPTTQDIASRSRCLIPARKRRNQR
jgi:hypothetical protein